MSERPIVGDVVEIHAVDWAFEDEQVSQAADFDIVRAICYGRVVRITDEFVTIVQQIFDGDDVRCALSMPWVTISECHVLQRVEQK
jgi:hypothetical protein